MHHLFNKLFVLQHIQALFETNYPGISTWHLQCAVAAHATALHRIFHLANHYATLDFNLSDVKNEDPANYGVERNRRITDLDDDGARTCTRFTRSQLRRLLHLFNLPAICQVPLRDNNQGQNEYYKMHREEILLLSLMKIAHGLDSSFYVSPFLVGT